MRGPTLAVGRLGHGLRRRLAGARLLARERRRLVRFTLAGLQPVEAALPVCHVSYYEADAFARFAGKHLPSEAEWEVAARAGELADAFGVAWQWTRSAYLPIRATGRRKGRSANTTASSWSARWCCAAPRWRRRPGTSGSVIATFFRRAARWQFSGLRLAEFRPERRVRHPLGDMHHECRSQAAPAFQPATLPGRLPMTSWRAFWRSRSGCRRNISTTSAARDCSSASPARRILPDPHRDRDPRGQCRRNRHARSGRCRAGRIRQRLEQEGAHSAARGAAGGGLCSGRYLRRDDRTEALRLRPDLPGLQVLPVTADITKTFELPPAGASRGSDFSRAPPSAISSRTRRRRSCATPAAFWARARR